ncbi:MAG: DNA polymerase III subunit gamma/tau [Cyanobacteria bacterium SZAS-4]|nr:DNA polymerase III subunit gamma/tau [Cyanobacteria bacterium SZAS-4]
MVQTYQPLYLKYRPQSLADLVGQKSVAQTLTNAIEHNRISHAYLFTGPRGTGKTSSARILAKSLNCEAGPTAAPCLVCASCLEIKAGNSPSVFELDAASNNSVDDARSLIERAPLVAQGGRYKLYIIDECHMLTKEAFNALLKTIEEPPPMVVFILATTEEHKVPPTIISRCQRLMFKLVNQKELTAHLRHISTLEEINILDEALDLIARRSGGGLRDALGLLDQASLLSTKEKPVGVNDLLILLGAVHEDVLLQISAAVQNRDGQAVLSAANTLLMEGREPAVLVLELAKHFLNLMKASYVNETGTLTAENLASLVLGSPSYLQAIVAQAKNFDRAELALMVEYLDKLEQTCRRSSQPVLSVEMGLLALCHRHDMTFVRDLDARVKTLENVMADDIARGPAQSSGPKPHAAPQQTRPVSQPDHRPAAQQDHRPAAAQTEHRTPPTHNPTQVPVAASAAAAAAADTRPNAESAPKTVAPKVERPAESAPPVAAKAPAPTSSFASKLNEAMASAGLGAGPSTSTFKSGGESAKPAAFPPPISRVPPEAPPDDSSYDDVEPDQPGRVVTPVLRPPVVEPTLEALEAQGDVVEEIDDYDIVPRSVAAPPEEPLPLSAPPLSNVPPSSTSGSSEEEEEEDDEEQAEAPIESDDDDDAGIPPAPLVIEDPTARSNSAPAATPSTSSQATTAAEPANESEPAARPSRGGGEDIDQFWSEVREALQKRHLPTFSIVSVHAFPVSLENNDFVVGVRNETFQKQLDNKIEHLKAACAAAVGRTINVRIKVVADNSPKPAVGAAKGAARPKETRSPESPEGESRTPDSPAPTRPSMNSESQGSAPKSDPNGHGPVRTQMSTEIEQRIGGNLINEAYKLFEGPGSRLIG